MSPEAVLGKSDVDHRADIYSLGCVAYWLATGRDLFEGETPMEVMVAHVQTVPVAPSEVAPHEIPTALEEIILACLAKDRDDRPARIEDLDLALATVESTPAWTNADAESWWREHAPRSEGETSAVATTKAADGLVLADTLPGASGQSQP